MTTIPEEKHAAHSSVSAPQGSLWKNIRFVRLFLAYALATFGDWFDALAIQVMIAYRWGADPLIIALVPVCMAIPGILFGSIAGTLADRWPKVNIMLICDAANVLLTVGILFAPGPGWLLPLLGARAMMGVFHIPAQQALTRQVVPEKHLLQATSMNGFVAQCSKVAGPLLGAVILAVFSPQICIVVNACSRLLSGMVLWPLRRLTEKAKTTDVDLVAGNDQTRQASWITQWKEGWIFLRSKPAVFRTIWFGCTGLLAILMIDYQFATLFRSIKPDNEVLVGWLGASAGAGAVAIIMVLNRLSRISYGWGLGGGFLLIGAGIAGLGWLEPSTHEGWIIFWGLCIGLGNGLSMVTMNYLLQKESPPDMVGRVFGIQNSMSSIVLVAAPLAGGVLIQAAGPGLTFVYIGAATFLVGLVGIVLQRLLWGATGNQPFEKKHASD